MQGALEESGVIFKLENDDKLHPRRWVSYLGEDEVSAKPTLGDCIWATARNLGESE